MNYRSERDMFLDEIKLVVTEAVSDGMKSHCPLSEEERRSVPHLYGLFKDMGDGDIDRGIRKFRAIFEFTGAIYTRKNLITGSLILGGFAAVFGWLGKVLIAGIIHVIKSAM